MKESATRGQNWRRRIVTLLGQYGVIIAFAIILVIFTIMLPGRFATGYTLLSVIRNSTILILIAGGLTLCLISGDFDLSVAAIAGLAGMMCAVAVAQYGIPLYAAYIISLVLGGLVGAVSGMIITFVGVSGIIVTLGIMSALNGLEYILSDGKQIFFGLPASFTVLGRDSLGGVPIQIIVTVVVLILLQLMMTQTEFGRRMIAVGGNLKASMLSGINTRRIRIFSFALSGVISALAGLILVSRQGLAFPLGANGYLLPAFATAFIGAVVFKQGEYNIPGTVVGALLMGTVSTGIVMLGVPAYISYIVQGLILIAALVMTGLVHRSVNK